MTKNYTVVVSGTELFRSTDFLVAHAYANLSKSKWKNVKEYIEVNGTSYHSETNDELIEVLERVRKNRTRIVLDYGNVKTRISWGEQCDSIGILGRSTGPIKVPILLFNKKSRGGGAILDHCILSVKESKGKKILYQLCNS